MPFAAALGVFPACKESVELDGGVHVATRDPGSGQGYPTAIAQIVADELGVEPERVHVSPWVDSQSSPCLVVIRSENLLNAAAVKGVVRHRLTASRLYA